MIRLYIIRLLFVLGCSFSIVAQAQEFYPVHFRELFTDEGVESSQIARLNGNYLSRKGFEYVNDSLYVHPQSHERVLLSTEQISGMNELVVYYFCSNNLDQFRRRLQDESAYLEQLSLNHYQAIFGQVSNAFIISQDTLVDNVVLHPVRFVLKYPQETKFSFSTERFTFPVNDIFPLQHTTWYFNIKYDESTSFSSQNQINMVLTQEEQPYKIEFIDDIHFKVSYVGKNKKMQSVGGTYGHGYSTLVFRSELEKEEEILRYVNGVPLYKKIPVAPSFYTPEQLNQVKNTPAYFQFIFSLSYDFIYYGGDNKFNLSGMAYQDYPTQAGPGRSD